MRLVGAVLAMTLCAGALAACSQEPGPEPEKETRQLSRAEFVERADEICRRGRERVDAIGERIEGRSPAARRAAVRDQVVPARRGIGAGIRALDGPPRLERRLEPVLADLDRLLDFIAEDPARDDDLLFVSVNRDLATLGFADCAQ